MKFIAFDDPKSPSIVFDLRDALGYEVMKDDYSHKNIANYVLTFPIDLFFNEGDERTLNVAKKNFITHYTPKLYEYIKKMPETSYSVNGLQHLEDNFSKIIKSLNKGVKFVTVPEGQKSIEIADETLDFNNYHSILVLKQKTPFTVGGERQLIVDVFNLGNSRNKIKEKLFDEDDKMSNKKTKFKKNEQGREL